MTPNDLYKLALTTEPMPDPIFRLVPYTSHIPEVNVTNLDEKYDRIKVYELVFVNIDGERYVTLRAVFFDDIPVMLIQGGADYDQRFITNKDRFRDMIDYIRLFNADDLIVHDPDEDNPDLTNFYGYGFGLNRALS